MSYYKTVFVEELEVRNPLITLHAESVETGGADDTHDIGVFGRYWNGANTIYTGLFRDASDSGTFKLFDSLQELPVVNTGSVNVGGTGYALADLDLANLTASGDVVITGDLTVNGTTTTINVETLTVEDNIIIANGGPANQKEDAGFVVARMPANVVSDTPKLTGTLTVAGTSSTVFTLPTGSHAAAASSVDYFKGWVIELSGGTESGVSIITSSTATNPVSLTLTSALTGTPAGDEVYDLFNKRLVGMIYDESADKISMFGFPREDTEAIIDPAGDAGNGNLADFVDLKVDDFETVGDVIIGGDLTVNGNFDVSFTDNILPVNVGGASADGGFVVQRSPTNIIASDPIKETGTVSAGTSSTVFSLATGSAGQGVTDYYKGWVIQLTGGTESGLATILSSTNATPAVVTVDTPMTGTPASDETYNLYNRRFIGTIYDESVDSVRVYGFPREDGENLVDPAAVNGNAAEFINFAANNIAAQGTLTAVGNISSSTGSVTAQTNVFATTGSVTAQTNVVATTGSVTAQTNVVATTGSVTAQTSVTAVTGDVIASAGDFVATLGDVIISAGDLIVTAGDATIGGDLTVSGVLKAEIQIDDNILVVNTGPVNQKDDAGFVVQRSVANIIAADVPLESGTATSGTSTTVFALQTGAHSDAQSNVNYYAGWVVELTGVGAGSSVVLSSTAANPVVLTLQNPLSGTPDNSTTYDLFNKRFVGSIYDESTDRWTLYGFPRESGESPIQTTSVLGNVASYIDMQVNNLVVGGSLTLTGGMVKNTLTQASSTTFTATQIKTKDIIYLDPGISVVNYTLPSIASLSLASDTAVTCTFVNINGAGNRANIIPDGANTIEGDAAMLLRQQWLKATLVFSAGLMTVLIE